MAHHDFTATDDEPTNAPTHHDLRGNTFRLSQLPGIRAIYPYGKAFAEGILEAGEAVPATVQAILEAPMRIPQEISGLIHSPETQVPAEIEAAKSLVPPSLRSLAAGDVPRGTDVARDLGNIVGSEAIPAAVGRVVKGGVRAGARRWPGAGVALQEAAIPEAEAAVRKLQPPKAQVDAAFAAASAQGAPPIWLGSLRKTARGLLRKELARGKLADAQRVSELRDYLKETRQGWSFDRYNQEAAELGAKMKEDARIGADERVKQRRKLLAALHADAAAAREANLVAPAVPPNRVYQRGQWVDIPGTPAKYGPGARTTATNAQARAFQAARRLARQRYGAQELVDAVTRAKAIVGDQHPQLSFNKLLSWMDSQAEKAANPKATGYRKARRLVESFQPGQWQAIRAQLAEIGRDIPAIPVRKGAAHGSGGYVMKGILGGIIGELFGAPRAGAEAAMGAYWLMGKAALTPAGRAAIKWAVRIDPNVGPLFRESLALALRAKSEPDAQIQGDLH